MILYSAVRFLTTIILWLAITSPLFAGERSAEEGEGYQFVSGGGTTVYYQPPDSKVALQYLAWAGEFHPRPVFLDGRRLNRVKIFISPTLAEYDRLTGGRLPEWGVACALPEEDLVIVRSPRIVPLWLEDPREILLHELSHVFLDQQLRPARIPRWFQEGYAVYCSSMWDAGNSLEFSVALLTGTFLPFQALSTAFPAGEAAARMAYLESYTAVVYLFTGWDDPQLALLFQRWRSLGDLDEALRTSLGLTLAQLEDRWREWVEVRYGWLKLLTSTSLLWIGAAALFIVVFISRRSKIKQMLKEMQQREAAGLEPPESGAGGPEGPEGKENASEEQEPRKVPPAQG